MAFLPSVVKPGLLSQETAEDLVQDAREAIRIVQQIRHAAQQVAEEVSGASLRSGVQDDAAQVDL